MSPWYIWSGWLLEYQVAAFGAYAAILVECVDCIFGGIETTSSLIISILTNGSTILVHGFSRPDSLPLATIRISLTTSFLLWSIISKPEKDAFDGTYAILCSFAHLVYQIRMRRHDDGSDVEDDLHRRETEKRSGEFTTCANEIDNHAARFKRHLIIQCGDNLRLDGFTMFIAVLGTATTYRVFDFDLGFGLVFAAFSAALCIALLLLINFTRKRGRLVEGTKLLQRLIGISIPLGIFFLGVLWNDDVIDLIGNIPWWKPTFAVAWFLWLFVTIYTPVRYLVHAELFPCAACRQSDLGHSLKSDVTPCPWEESATLPKLNTIGTNEQDFTTILIKRRKGPDLVDRYWLNHQPWFQISPRGFVLVFFTMTFLAAISQWIPGDHARKEMLLKFAAFYVAMVYTFMATGHLPVEGSPEMVNVAISKSFPDWKATVEALCATLLVHTILIFVTTENSPIGNFGGAFIPFFCTAVTPLLMYGVSTISENLASCQDDHSELNLESIQQDYDAGSGNYVADEGEAQMDDNIPGFIRRMVVLIRRTVASNAHVLFVGHITAVVDIISNYGKEGVPVTAIVALSTLYLLLFLKASVCSDRRIEPYIFCCASVVLVGIHSQFDVLGIFVPSLSFLAAVGQCSPISISLWYAVLYLMVMTNRRLADQTLRTNLDPAKKDHLLISLRIGRVHTNNVVWQLRNSRVAVCLLLAFVSVLYGDDWPLPINSTVSSLACYLFIVGISLLPQDEVDEANQEKRSKLHLAVLTFCVSSTSLITALNQKAILDFGDGWTTTVFAALIAYTLPLMLVQIGKIFRRTCLNSVEARVDWG